MWFIAKIAGLVVAWLLFAAICGGMCGWYMSKWYRSAEGRRFRIAVNKLKCAVWSAVDSHLRPVLRYVDNALDGKSKE